MDDVAEDGFVNLIRIETGAADSPCRRTSGIHPLAQAGVPIWIDNQVRIAHAKTMVIDGAVTLLGSYNWTAGAAPPLSESR